MRAVSLPDDAAPHDDTVPRKVEIHHDHRNVTGGWLRPAVFGAMDGLVSNFALMAGVAGGVSASQADLGIITLSGFAGLAAGAFSMAAGEYTSVASQSELAMAEIEIERQELALRPDAEAAELVELYVSRGIPRPLATKVVDEINKDPERALEIHTREEIGIDPYDLPSPWVAAGSSFLAFAVGALVPLVPYLLGTTSITWSLVLSLAALFGCGAAVSRITSQSWWFGGLRQVLIGGAAAGLTYLLGSVIGTGLG
jgi:vacuolar iron transporter family protein